RDRPESHGRTERCQHSPAPDGRAARLAAAAQEASHYCITLTAPPGRHKDRPPNARLTIRTLRLTGRYVIDPGDGGSAIPAGVPWPTGVAREIGCLCVAGPAQWVNAN